MLLLDKSIKHTFTKGSHRNLKNQPLSKQPKPKSDSLKTTPSTQVSRE